MSVPHGDPNAEGHQDEGQEYDDDDGGGGAHVASVMKVEFITRENCPLCDEAEEMLATWAGEFGLEVEVLDVDQDAILYEAFTDRVPVLRSAGGEVLAEGRWLPDPPAQLTRR